mmetsp:Transcript_29919/g.48210  ORF Transcript_29919/g.48210 Transcript_29919/m.48210 type:complete len:96 (+) Transcript_29919:209-496(+)
MAISCSLVQCRNFVLPYVSFVPVWLCAGVSVCVFLNHSTGQKVTATHARTTHTEPYAKKMKESNKSGKERLTRTNSTVTSAASHGKCMLRLEGGA